MGLRCLPFPFPPSKPNQTILGPVSALRKWQYSGKRKGLLLPRFLCHSFLSSVVHSFGTPLPLAHPPLPSPQSTPPFQLLSATRPQSPWRPNYGTGLGGKERPMESIQVRNPILAPIPLPPQAWASTLNFPGPEVLERLVSRYGVQGFRVRLPYLPCSCPHRRCLPRLAPCQWRSECRNRMLLHSIRLWVSPAQVLHHSRKRWWYPRTLNHRMRDRLGRRNMTSTVQAKEASNVLVPLFDVLPVVYCTRKGPDSPALSSLYLGHSWLVLLLSRGFLFLFLFYFSEPTEILQPSCCSGRDTHRPLFSVQVWGELCASVVCMEFVCVPVPVQV